MKRLVPSRELCEKIPAGNFDNAVYAWHLADVSGFVCGKSGCRTIKGQQWQLVKSSKHKLDEARAAGELIFPAPTLSEIMENLPKDDGQNDLHLNHFASGKLSGWHIYYIGDHKRHCYDQTAVTAAMKLWLKVNKKGIENE